VKRYWKILGMGASVSLSGILLAGALTVSSRSIDSLHQSSRIQSPKPLSNQLPKPSLDKLGVSSAQAIPGLTTADSKRFASLRFQFKQQKQQNLEVGDRIQVIAEQFLGEQYQANLLEQSSTEQPFISLHQFDCVLFLETILALTTVLSKNSDNTEPLLSSMPSISQSESELFTAIQRYRYRDGKIDGYCSRLHYFSDWILDNQRRGNVDQIVQDPRSTILMRPLNFMSNNWQKYPPLVKNPALRDCIAQSETKISNQLKTSALRYIPTQELRSQQSKLRSGDLVGIVTNMNGLDVIHSGFLYRKQHSKLQTGLIHASIRSGIKISPDLERYVRGVEGAIGIVVARPVLVH
jgi:hypothetical protein